MTKQQTRKIENRERLGRTVVHILRHGLPVCLFTTDEPAKWPDGHRWLRQDQPRHKITCGNCLKTAKAGGF